MVEQLFGSKTRVKLLQLFYSNPNRSYFVREITRKIDEQINSVRRELANLLSIGIISSDNTNNKLYYEVNQEYQYYPPLKTIFGQDNPTEQATSVGAPKAAKPFTPDHDKIIALGNVEVALYTGHFTRDETSGVDMLVVGDVNQHALAKFIAEIEKQENKEMRYTLMSAHEFNYRRQINDRFINLVLGSKVQVLVDKNSIF